MLLGEDSRKLGPAHIDSRALLSVVLAGDGRQTDLFRREDLRPLGRRIRTRLSLDYATREELRACLEHLLAAAGNATLMTALAMAATLTCSVRFTVRAGLRRILSRCPMRALVPACERRWQGSSGEPARDLNSAP